MSDGAGTVETPRYDFKGNVLETRRRFLDDPRRVPDWAEAPTPALAAGTHTTLTSYDALNRLVELTAPDGSVETYSYNETNLVETVAVAAPDASATLFVEDVDYDAKGQRRFIRYGNGVETDYEYEAETDRAALIRTRRVRTAPCSSGSPTPTIPSATSPRSWTAHCRLSTSTTPRWTRVARSATTPSTAWLAPLGASTLPRTSHPDWSDAPRMALPHKTDGNALQRYRQFFEYDQSGNLTLIQHVAGRGVFATPGRAR